MSQAGSEQFLAYLAQQGGGSTPGHDLTATAIPGFEQMGPLANGLVQWLGPGLMAQQGLALGQFMPSVNVADLLRADAERKQMMQLMADNATEIDTNTWLKGTAGAMRLMGANYGLDQQAGFRNAYRQAAPTLSMLAAFAPELVDQLHGSKGSAAVMAQHLFRGGQYRADALHGQPGMSPDDIKELSSVIEKHLYGTPEAVADMRGVGMGQLGKIFDEAQRRGYMPGSLSVRSRDGQLKGLSEATGKTLDELEKMDDAEFGRNLQRFDATRISTRLKDLAGSISAMRDLFGSMGQSNAPMTQLISALEAITQNKLASMPAGEVEMTVRKTKALMETTGIGLDGLMRLTSIAAGYGDQMGLDRSLAILSGQHAAGFSAAYKQAFGSSFSAFGAMSADELAQREALLGQRAAGSEQAQLAGAMLRTVQGFKLDDKTRAGRLATAIKNGELEFEGKSMYQVLRQDNLRGILAESGVGEAGLQAFGTAARDKFGNQEFIQRHDIGALVRRLQPQEVVERMGRGAGEAALISSLMGTGMSQEQARAGARNSGSTLLRALLDTESPEKLSTQQGRQEIIQQTLEKQFGKETAARIAPSVALSFESHMNRQAQQYGFGDMTKLLQSQNRTVLRQEAQVQRTAAAEAEIGKALSPLGKAGPLARAIDLIQSGKNNEEIGKLIGKALGGLDVDQVRKLLDTTKEIRGLSGKETLSDADRKALDTARTRLTDQVKDITVKAQEAGVDVGRHVDDEAVERAAGSGEEVQEALKSDKNRHQRVARASRMQLTRTNNLVQALYLDDASVRKLGVGGVEQLKSLEAKYTRMMRLVGGDTDLLARALEDDAKLPAELRKEVQGLQKQLDRETKTLGKELTGDGTKMTDEEFAAEKKKLEEFRKTRETDDKSQVKQIIDQIAEVGGIDLKDISDDDRRDLSKYLGRFGETKRKDIMLAVDARKRLQAAADEQGLTLSELKKKGEFAEDFAQAGALADFGVGRNKDMTALEESLKGFGEADEGAVPGRQEMTLRGTLTIPGVGDGELAGVGYSGFSGGAV